MSDIINSFENIGKILEFTASSPKKLGVILVIGSIFMTIISWKSTNGKVKKFIGILFIVGLILLFLA